MKFEVKSIGIIHDQENKFSIHLQTEYLPGLNQIEGFSHLLVIWWAHLTENVEARTNLIAKNIFRHAPDEVGVFASRTPERPNPLMISIVKIETIDFVNGIITTPFIDAEDGTPVLDIKPYFPVERLRNCKTPAYYNHWPQWAEDAPGFDWKSEISFDAL